MSLGIEVISTRGSFIPLIPAIADLELACEYVRKPKKGSAIVLILSRIRLRMYLLE